MAPMAARNPLFLRDEALAQCLDMLMLAGLELARPVREHLAGQRLTMTDFTVLSLVRRQPRITMAELARAMHLPKQNLSRHVTMLVERGLLAATPASEDRRKRLLTVTPAGLDLARRLDEMQTRLLRRAFRRTGAAAVEGFRDVLQELGPPQRRQPAAGPAGTGLAEAGIQGDQR